MWFITCLYIHHLVFLPESSKVVYFDVILSQMVPSHWTTPSRRHSLESGTSRTKIFWFQLSLFSCSDVSGSLRPHGLQHSRLPSPSPSPGACSNSCSLSRWCHPTTSSSVIPFSSCLQSFPASGSFLMSQLLTSGGQSIGASVSASTSVLPISIQGWFPLRLTGLISLQSKGLSRFFSNTTV